MNPPGHAPSSTPLLRARVLTWFHALDLDGNGFVTRGDLMHLAWSTVRVAGSSRSSDQTIRLVEAHEDLWDALWAHLGRPHSDGGPLHSSDF